MGVGKRDLEGWVGGKKTFLGELKRGWVLVGKLKKMVGGLQGLGGSPNEILLTKVGLVNGNVIGVCNPNY